MLINIIVYIIPVNHITWKFACCVRKWNAMRVVYLQDFLSCVEIKK